MVWCIRNVQIIYDRFPFQIFNNYILLFVILSVRRIVVVWLERIVLLTNVLFIITFNFILTLVFFIYIFSYSSYRYMYTCNYRHTWIIILLVLPIIYPFQTRIRTWPWWLMWGKFISHSLWYIYDDLKQELVSILWGHVNSGITLLQSHSIRNYGHIPLQNKGVYTSSRKRNIKNLPIHLCIFKNRYNFTTNYLHMIYWKIYFSTVKIFLEYAKRLCVPGLWQYSTSMVLHIVLDEAPFSTLTPTLGSITVGVDGVFASAPPPLPPPDAYFNVCSCWWLFVYFI